MYRANALGEFIRAHRAATTPAQVGLDGGGSRRTAGLRREEVAALAGLSEGYYARLEQGREEHPSNQVLDALIRVFQLDAETAEHMYRLARLKFRSQAGLCMNTDQQVSPDLVRLISGWDIPAIVVGPRLDILAANTLSRALFSPVGPETNAARFMFLDPAARDFYRDWEEMTQPFVAALRASADLGTADRLKPLIDELVSNSWEFRSLWAGYEVRMKMRRYKRYFHPEVGGIELESHHFSVNDAPGQRLITWQAQSGTGSQEALDFLRAIAAAE
ncbi:helix-turn-helix transcriptional regulator [Streptomyces sp. NPDC005708]|uniref:helix-turn-helix transcriptional regulator n=1 Tax=Streptomyces sp. NPDC005708 TaxID=3154564 RepID=UPI0033E355FC